MTKTSIPAGERTHFYTYHVNLNERGSFRADVRDSNEQTVFEVLAGAELGEDETSLVEDGFMLHLLDREGLETYLRTLGVLGSADRITATYR